MESEAEIPNWACGVCRNKPECLVTLTNTKIVVRSCQHRVGHMIAYLSFTPLASINEKAIKYALKYWNIREEQHPRALREIN